VNVFADGFDHFVARVREEIFRLSQLRFVGCRETARRKASMIRPALMIVGPGTGADRAPQTRAGEIAFVANITHVVKPDSNIARALATPRWHETNQVEQRGEVVVPGSR
jgi:hypothetical protein